MPGVLSVIMVLAHKKLQWCVARLKVPQEKVCSQHHHRGLLVSSLKHSDGITVSCTCIDTQIILDVFSANSGPIFLDHLACNGKEANLLECNSFRQTGLSLCFHDEDVGVRCAGMLPNNSVD